MGGGEGMDIPPPPLAQAAAIPLASSAPASTRRAMRINRPPESPMLQRSRRSGQPPASAPSADGRSLTRRAYGALGAGAATDQWALRNFHRPSRRSATAVK